MTARTQDPTVCTPSVVARALTVPIRAYQAVRGGRPSPCRYWPSCSQYAVEALEAHGARRGSWLAVRRLLRCHPWARRSGVDLVPGPEVAR
ncbi:MAG TPA: membrane protein insertion efficiency factor YidD [Acidimicrobiales bacterium]|nr:membrane protein insertion efficiency factor YidD [Acidimicrobiales bacterium]